MVVQLVMFILSGGGTYISDFFIDFKRALFGHSNLGPHAHDVLPCSIYVIAVSSAGNMKVSLMSIALVAILFSTGLGLL